MVCPLVSGTILLQWIQQMSKKVCVYFQLHWRSVPAVYGEKSTYFNNLWLDCFIPGVILTTF